MTIKELLLEVVDGDQYQPGTGDKPEGLICFVRRCDPSKHHMADEFGPLERLAFADLPEDEYDASYGGTEGPQFIAFSERYVYISVQYDGSEWIEAIPRHPEYVEVPIPWPGN